MSKLIKKVAEETMGTKVVGGSRKKQTPWWNEEVKNAVLEKIRKMRLWLKHRTPETREEYVQARNATEEMKRDARINVWRKLGEEIEVDMSRGKKKVFWLAKLYRKDKTKVHNIKDEDGNVIVEGHKINERWQDYFKDLLNAGVDEEEVEQGQEDLITMEEMERALKKMKRDKSPGCNEIQI